MSSHPSTPTRALIPLSPPPPPPEAENPQWQPILHHSAQVVLYNPTSHALAIRPREHTRLCPYCSRPLHDDEEDDESVDGSINGGGEGSGRGRVSNYFQLLAIANETSSRPGTPPAVENGSASTSAQGRRRSAGGGGGAFAAEAMAEGYFSAFFQEEYKLGMGANGSVFLCQHVLDGNPLGHFAVKKIAVGESHAYLLQILREVRLLERLHHPNIITYHHAWLESAQFSSFGPRVPTLHVLMQWAEGGSLDDFISTRLGRPSTAPIHHHPATSSSSPQHSLFATPPTSTRHQQVAADGAGAVGEVRGRGGGETGEGEETEGGEGRAARIRAFRALQRAPPAERARLRQEFDVRFGSGVSGSGGGPTWTAVHLLSAEEVKSLFSDVVEGLAFLHDKSILHLDLKPGNVLLTWDEGRLVPRAMLSDFGTSRDMLHSSRARSGNTGTLEYTAPETLPSPQTGFLQQIDSKADMWSLGMILHKLLFFRLPYCYASDGDASAGGDEGRKMDQLEREVLSYTGFKTVAPLVTAFETRRLPRAFLVLLESLLNVVPATRPSCERVVGAIREGRLDPITPDPNRRTTSLIPVARRPTTDSVDSQETARGDGARVLEDGDREDDDDDDGASGLSEKRERMPLLELPAPALETSSVVWRFAGRQLRVSQTMLVRTIKSCILAAKALTLVSHCSNAQTLIRPAALLVVLALAVADTLFDGMWLSAVFGLMHLVIMKVVCGGGRCCV